MQPAAEAGMPTPVLPAATLVLPTATSAPPTSTSAADRDAVPATETGVSPTATPVPPTMTPIPTLAPGATRVSDKDGMVQVYVPAGEFMMGSTDSDAEPTTRSRSTGLPGCLLDRQDGGDEGQYRRCVEAGKCAAPRARARGRGITRWCA